MIDASLFAQPFQGGMGPPQSPEEYQDRYRQWMDILQNPQTQQYLHESGLARGLLSFGSRLAQNMGTGNPLISSLGNAMETGVGTYDDVQRTALEGAMQLAKGQQGTYEKGLDYWNEQARLGLEEQKNRMLAPVYQEQAGMYNRSNRGTSEDNDPYKTAKNAFEHAQRVLGVDATPEQLQVFAEYIMEERRYPPSDRDPHFRSWLDRKKGKGTSPEGSPPPADKGVPLATRARQVGGALADVFNQARPRGGVLPGQSVTEGAFGGLTRNMASGARQAADTVQRVTSPPRAQAVTDDVGRAIERLKRDPGGYASSEDWHYIIQNMDKLQSEPHISNGDLEWVRSNVPPSMLASTTRVPKNRQYR